jgi:hypothetical protein
MAEFIELFDTFPLVLEKARSVEKAHGNERALSAIVGKPTHDRTAG